jgi:hypothetical protein
MMSTSEYQKGRFTIQDFNMDDGYDGDSEPPRVPTPSALPSQQQLAQLQQQMNSSESDSKQTSADSIDFGHYHHQHNHTYHIGDHQQHTTQEDFLHEAVPRRTSSVPPSWRMGRFEIRDMGDHEFGEDDASLKSGEEIEVQSLSKQQQQLFERSLSETDIGNDELLHHHHPDHDHLGRSLSSPDLGVVNQNRPFHLEQQQHHQHHHGPTSSYASSGFMHTTTDPLLSTYTFARPIAQLGTEEILEVLRQRCMESNSETRSLMQENMKLRQENARLRNLCLSLAKSAGLDIAGALSETPRAAAATSQQRV